MKTYETSNDETMTINLLQAWSIWAQGGDLHSELLWGRTILFWGRIGKLLELFSGLAVVLEIIGPERVRAFGGSLHVVVRSQKLARSLRSAWVVAIVGIYDQFAGRQITIALDGFVTRAYLKSARRGRHFSSGVTMFRLMRELIVRRLRLQEAQLQIGRSIEATRWIVSAFYATLLTVAVFADRHKLHAASRLEWVLYAFAAVIITLVMHRYLSAWISGSVLAVLLSLGAFLDHLLLQPIAWTLESPSLGTAVKVLSVVLLIVGFHFDFLAS